MTTNDQFGIIANRHYAGAVDEDTAARQIEILLDMKTLDAPRALLRLALELNSTKAQLSAARRLAPK